MPQDFLHPKCADIHCTEHFALARSKLGLTVKRCRCEGGLSRTDGLDSMRCHLCRAPDEVIAGRSSLAHKSFTLKELLGKEKLEIISNPIKKHEVCTSINCEDHRDGSGICLSGHPMTRNGTCHNCVSSLNWELLGRPVDQESLSALYIPTQWPLAEVSEHECRSKSWVAQFLHNGADLDVEAVLAQALLNNGSLSLCRLCEEANTQVVRILHSKVWDIVTYVYCCGVCATSLDRIEGSLEVPTVAKPGICQDGDWLIGTDTTVENKVAVIRLKGAPASNSLIYKSGQAVCGSGTTGFSCLVVPWAEGDISDATCDLTTGLPSVDGRSRIRYVIDTNAWRDIDSTLFNHEAELIVVDDVIVEISFLPAADSERSLISLQSQLKSTPFRFFESDATKDSAFIQAAKETGAVKPATRAAFLSGEGFTSSPAAIQVKLGASLSEGYKTIVAGVHEHQLSTLRIPGSNKKSTVLRNLAAMGLDRPYPDSEVLRTFAFTVSLVLRPSKRPYIDEERKIALELMEHIEPGLKRELCQYWEIRTI